MVLTPNLADVILAAIDARLDGVFTAMPGRVVAYNASEQSADVQPTVKHAYLDEQGNRVVEPLPVVPRVPVCFPGAGSSSITWPVNPGDTVLLVFCNCSIDKLLVLGGVVDPEDDRRHHLGDAIAIPGFRDFKNALKSTAVDSSALVVGASTIKLGSSNASEEAVLGTTFSSALQTLIDAISTAIAAMADTPTQATAATTLATAVSTFEGVTYLSSKVKVE